MIYLNRISLRSQAPAGTSVGVGVRCLLLVALMLFSGAIPGLRTVTESEASLAESRLVEEAAIREQTEARFRQQASNLWVKLGVDDPTQPNAARPPGAIPRVGHRFCNHLLAPLRC